RGLRMSRNLLVLVGIVRRLTLTGRAMAAMLDRYAMARAQSSMMMPLYGAGEALADRDADNVDMLTGEKMGGSDFRADRQQSILGNAKLGETRLRFDLRLGEMAALRFGHILRLRGADAELQGCVTV